MSVFVFYYTRYMNDDFRMNGAVGEQSNGTAIPASFLKQISDFKDVSVISFFKIIRYFSSI